MHRITCSKGSYRIGLFPRGTDYGRSDDGDGQRSALVHEQVLGEGLREGVGVGPLADQLRRDGIQQLGLHPPADMHTRMRNIPFFRIPKKIWRFAVIRRQFCSCTFGTESIFC